MNHCSLIIESLCNTIIDLKSENNNLATELDYWKKKYHKDVHELLDVSTNMIGNISTFED